MKIKNGLLYLKVKSVSLDKIDNLEDVKVYKAEKYNNKKLDKAIKIAKKKNLKIVYDI